MPILVEGHILLNHPTLTQMHVSSVRGYFEFVYNFGLLYRGPAQTLMTGTGLARVCSLSLGRCSRSRRPVASTGAGLWGNVLLVRFSDTDDRVTTHVDKTLSLQGGMNHND